MKLMALWVRHGFAIACWLWFEQVWPNNCMSAPWQPPRQTHDSAYPVVQQIGLHCEGALAQALLEPMGTRWACSWEAECQEVPSTHAAIQCLQLPATQNLQPTKVSCRPKLQ